MEDNKGRESLAEPQEEDCKPLTDEEFKALQEKDRRTENKVRRFFSAIWEAINFFS